MKNKYDNLAIIGGDNDLPLDAYNSVKKNLISMFILIFQKKISHY